MTTDLLQQERDLSARLSRAEDNLLMAVDDWAQKYPNWERSDHEKIVHLNDAYHKMFDAWVSALAESLMAEGRGEG